MRWRRRRRRRRVFPPRGCVTRGTAQIRFSSLNALSVLALQARCSLQESRRRPSARFIAFPPGFVSFSRFVSPFISPPAAPRRAPLSFSLSLFLSVVTLSTRRTSTTFRRRSSCSFWHFSSGRVTLVSFFARALLPLPLPRPLCPRITPSTSFSSSFLPSFLLLFFPSLLPSRQSRYKEFVSFNPSNPRPPSSYSPRRRGISDQSAAVENL